jgi:hypothetical protein
MWDFNWGMFWALVACGVLKFGVKRALGLYGEGVSQTSHNRIHSEHSLLLRKVGVGRQRTPRRPAPSKPVLANDSAHAEEFLLGAQRRARPSQVRALRQREEDKPLAPA